MHIKHFLCILFCCLAFPLYATEVPDSLSYNADYVVYSQIDSSITLSGNCTAKYQGITLTADSIRYFINSKILLSTGNPILIDGTDTITGDYIAYNLSEKSGKVKHSTFRSPDNTFYSGKRIARTDSSIYVDQGCYSTCINRENPHSHFYSEKIRIIPQKRTIVKPFVLSVAQAPVFAIPYFIIPLEKDQQNGWLAPKWGVGIDGSGSIDNIGYFWAPNDYVDFMLAGKVDDFNDFLVKGETRYALKNRLNGRIYADYSLTDQYLGKRNRWSLNFDHSQNLLPDNSFTLKGTGRIVSDKNYFSDYSEDTTFLLDQDLSTNLALTKRFEELGAYASATWSRQQNLQKETVTQDLPSLNFTLNSRPLIPLKEDTSETTHFLSELQWSYSAKANQKQLSSYKTDSTYDRTHRGFSHSIPLSMPLTLFDYIRVTPKFNIGQSVFDSYRDTIPVIDTIHETLYDTISLEESGWFEYAEKEKDTVYLPNAMNPDTIYVLVHEGDTAWTENRYDTTYWNDDRFDFDKAHALWWNTGIDFNTDLYGIVPITLGRLRGIRHTFSPRIGYQFIPKNDIDVVFPSIGLSTPYGTKQRQEISFGINNLFEAKFLERPKEDTTSKSDEKNVSFLSLNLSGKYDFEAETRKWSDFSLSGMIPTSIVNLSYQGRYQPYNVRDELIFPTAISHDITINPQIPTITGSFWSGDLITFNNLASDGYLDNLWKSKNKGWQLSLTPRYNLSMRREDSESEFKTSRNYNLSASLAFAFSDRLSVRWGGTWSFTENTFINQSVALYADLECWELEVDWYPTGVNSGRIYFVASLKKHRDLKWEQSEG